MPALIRQLAPSHWPCIFIAILLTGTASAEHLAVPVSTQLIVGRVILNGGDFVRFSLLEGAMLSVQTDAEVYSLIPHILDQEAGRVRFDVYEVVGREGKRDILQTLGSAKIRGVEIEEATGIDGILRIEVNEIRESGFTQEKLEALRAEVTAKPGWPLLRDPA